MNTPLSNADFSCVVPTPNAVATPNTVLATPFKSQRSDSTPGSVRQQNALALPGQTPVRDKLNINPEEALEVSQTPLEIKQLKDQLRAGLSTLPEPKNDYEIVVPEEEINEDDGNTTSADVVEDQADIDARSQQELLEKR